MAELIVALDMDERKKALEIIGQVREVTRFFKIGAILYTALGPEIVRKLADEGLNIFLDLKFHDIPATVAGVGVAAAALGVRMFDVHTSGGYDMMAAVADAVRENSSKTGRAAPLILGVTVLTSLDDKAVHKIFNPEEDARSIVTRLALEAKRAGLDGVISSPLEAPVLRKVCGDEFKLVTPGIRPATYQQSTKDDQARVLTPAGAVKAGSDYLVVGRPVTKAADPGAAAQQIIEEMNTATGDPD